MQKEIKIKKEGQSEMTLHMLKEEQKLKLSKELFQNNMMQTIEENDNEYVIKTELILNN